MGGRIVAIGGGGFFSGPEHALLDEFVVSQAETPTPRVCFIPTASGDNDAYVAAFYRAFGPLDCRPSDLTLFDRRVDELEAFVLQQDVVYVGGGSTANLLAVWRVHGLDDILARAWESGVVLCGISAGMNCWFAESVTDSFGRDLAPLHDGMGLIQASSCPHYDGEEQRRPVFQRLVGTAELGPGWAADDGAALVFNDRELVEVVSSRPNARAYRIELGATGGVEERPLQARYLGAPG